VTAPANLAESDAALTADESSVWSAFSIVTLGADGAGRVYHGGVAYDATTAAGGIQLTGSTARPTIRWRSTATRLTEATHPDGLLVESVPTGSVTRY
jgi:hypothetical protein